VNSNLSTIHNQNHPKVYEAAEDLISMKFHYNWKNEKGREIINH